MIATLARVDVHGGTMAEKSCFVVMPIRSQRGADGGAEYRHFRTLYDDWIKPVPVDHGYDVVRADDITQSGAITQDVVRRLADADLVIADLTTLNPNVFYELGVRHSLCGYGTIMILDEAQEDAVPFDLGDYRVLKFSSDMFGLGRLRQGLDDFIKGITENEAGSTRDNPVHAFLPSLPVNALTASTGSEQGRLRQQLVEVTRDLEMYRRRYGDIGPRHEGASSY
nr:hypothetical protein [Micromonospora sp. DSM 115978]